MENVIVKEDNASRNKWKLARVVEATEDEDELVRKTMLQLGQSNLKRKCERLSQPSKFVLIESNHQILLSENCRIYLIPPIFF